MASKIKVGDLKNSLDILERNLRRIDGLSELLGESYDDIRRGEPRASMKILKILLLCTVRELADHIISRGCSSTSNDKKIVLIAFDFLRQVKMNLCLFHHLIFLRTQR